MRSTILAVLAAAASVAAAPVPSAQFSVSAPKALSQCAPATFSWTATSAPYYLSIVSSESAPSEQGDFTLRVPQQNKATWVVDGAAGSTVTVWVRDATGEVAMSQTMVIGEGSDRCL